MAGIPDRMHGAMIRQAVDQARYEAGLRQRVLDLLKKLERQLVHDIQDAELDTARTDWQKARLRNLLGLADEKIRDFYGRVESMTSEELAGLVQVAGTNLAKLLNHAVGADVLQRLNWTDAQLRAIADETLVFGAPAKEWWSRQATELSQAFADQMREGMLRGETIQELTWRVAGKAAGPKYPAAPGIMEVSRRNAEALVRTSVLTVANEAHLQTFQANDGVIKGLQWVSTLDSRTTAICRALDGKMWDLDYQPIEGNTQPFPGPIAHWNCRSTQVPVLKSWEELAKEAGGNTGLASQLDQMSEPDRASIDGGVSGKLTYEDWFKAQSEADQKDILGEAKWAIWKRGNLSFSDMVDQRGNELTLEQLRARLA